MAFRKDSIIMITRMKALSLFKIASIRVKVNDGKQVRIHDSIVTYVGQGH